MGRGFFRWGGKNFSARFARPAPPLPHLTASRLENPPHLNFRLYPALILATRVEEGESKVPYPAKELQHPPKRLFLDFYLQENKTPYMYVYYKNVPPCQDFFLRPCLIS